MMLSVDAVWWSSLLPCGHETPQKGDLEQLPLPWEWKAPMGNLLQPRSGCLLHNDGSAELASFYIC